MGNPLRLTPRTLEPFFQNLHKTNSFGPTDTKYPLGYIPSYL